MRCHFRFHIRTVMEDASTTMVPTRVPTRVPTTKIYLFFIDNDMWIVVVFITIAGVVIWRCWRVDPRHGSRRDTPEGIVWWRRLWRNPVDLLMGAYSFCYFRLTDLITFFFPKSDKVSNRVTIVIQGILSVYCKF